MELRSKGLLVQLVVIVLAAAPGAATVDLSGEWRISSSLSLAGPYFRFSQTGTSLQIVGRSTLESAGTIDPDTGVFSVSRTLFISFLVCEETIDGVASPDGLTFSGAYAGECPGFTTRGPFPITGARCDGAGVNCCGNGIQEPDELCEGECCDSCTAFSAHGVACRADQNVCTDDVCDGAGTCAHEPNTSPCTPTSFCDPFGTCSGGTCAPNPCAHTADVELVSFTSDPFRPLRWKWRDRSGTALADFGDPQLADYDVCYTVPHSSAVARVVYGMAANDWKATRRGFVFENTSVGVSGVARLRIKTGPRGATISAIAPPPTVQAPITGPVNVRLISRVLPGACFDSTFTNPSVNSLDKYRARD